MSKFSSMIEQIANDDTVSSADDFQEIGSFPWHERCYILAGALEQTKGVYLAPVLAKKLIQEFTERYIEIIKPKLSSIGFSEHKADLIRTLTGFNCSSLIFELLDVLGSDNYEQAYTAYKVLVNADFELASDLKSRIKKQVSDIKHLSFCENKKQLKAAIGDISENLQL